MVLIDVPRSSRFPEVINGSCHIIFSGVSLIFRLHNAHMSLHKLVPYRPMANKGYARREKRLRGKDFAETICHNCGDRDHKSAACPIPECFNCFKQDGHWAGDCKLKKMSRKDGECGRCSTGNGVDTELVLKVHRLADCPLYKGCHYCGGKTHHTYNCTDQTKRQRLN